MTDLNQEIQNEYPALTEVVNCKVCGKEEKISNEEMALRAIFNEENTCQECIDNE